MRIEGEVRHAASCRSYDGCVRRLYRVDAGSCLARRIIFSDGIGYDLDEQPMKFASTAAMHGIGALLFAWLAARRRRQYFVASFCTH